MTVAKRFAHWYEQECDANTAMLSMLGSVPNEARSDARFARAVTLAAHLAACRENWLSRMKGGDSAPADWWPDGTDLNSLRPRYEALQAAWGSYLSELKDDDLAGDFEFHASDGKRYRWSIEGQIVQLVGHAFYHRGQIALLVDALGGETVDTDYLYWSYQRNPNYGPV